MVTHYLDVEGVLHRRNLAMAQEFMILVFIGNLKAMLFDFESTKAELISDIF
jgi:hypothetical protein